MGLTSFPLCLPGNEALSLLTRILLKADIHINFVTLCIHMQELCTCSYIYLPMYSMCFHFFVSVNARCICVLCLCICVCICGLCVCAYRVVFSVCESSTVRFPVLPPPPPPSSFFPLSNLKDESKRRIY